MLDVTAALEDVMRAPQGPGTGASAAVRQLATSILTHANEAPGGFPEALQRAFVDASRRLDRVSIAVTGLGWLGSGVPSVEQQVIALIRGAQREVTLCAYAITAGALPFLREMGEVVNQGVNATLIVNAFNQQPTAIQAYLKDAARVLPQRWRILDFSPLGSQTELHAKVLVVDRSVALVGSANLSFHGMVSNHEMAVIVRGPTAESIAERLDMLARGAAVRSSLS